MDGKEDWGVRDRGEEADFPCNCDSNMVGETEKTTLKSVLDRAERDTVERVLQQTGNHVAEAAAILGVVRPSLYRIMKRHGITPPTQARTKSWFGPRSDRGYLMPETANLPEETELSPSSQ